MEERKEEKHDCKSKFQVYEIFEVINSIRPVSVEGVMDTSTKFATSAFQHDNHVTLNAQGHGHSFIDRIQHLTSHKVLGNCDDLGSSP